MKAAQTSRATAARLDRPFRAALLWTWRQLRLSVAMGRPISLPNLVRLYRRKANVMAGRVPEAEYLRRVDESVHLLTNAYRQRQPFARAGCNGLADS